MYSLDLVQGLHHRYVDVLLKNSLTPYVADLAPSDTMARQKLSDTWQAIIANDKLNISNVPSTGGLNGTQERLAEFDTQMHSMHARLLARSDGRLLLTEHVSQYKPTAVFVSPYHPDVVEILGGHREVGAEASITTLDALATSTSQPNAGSSTIITMPHNLRDSHASRDNEAFAPAFIIYGHELIHALHNKHGINARDLGELAEEHATVAETEQSRHLHRAAGVPVITEASLRAEHGLPARGNYFNEHTSPFLKHEFEAKASQIRSPRVPYNPFFNYAGDHPLDRLPESSGNDQSSAFQPPPVVRKSSSRRTRGPRP